MVDEGVGSSNLGAAAGRDDGAASPACGVLSTRFRWPAGWVAGITALTLGAMLFVPRAILLTDPTHYAVVHSGLEFVAVAVSAMVFALGWSLRDEAPNSHAVLLAVAFLAVALIDFAHIFSYAGMPAFVTPSDPEKAINFWLAGRYVTGLALMAVALLRLRHWTKTGCFAALGAAGAVAAAVWWLGLFHQDWLPRTFIAGSGLTGFKSAAEYGLVALYLLASVLLFERARRDDAADLCWLAAAAWVLGLGELFFAVYVDVDDLFNFLGHVFKALAYGMIYQALFAAGVRAPYRALADERALLRAIIDSVPDLIFVKNRAAVYVGFNKAFAAYCGRSEAEVVGRPGFDFAPRRRDPSCGPTDREIMAGEGPRTLEEWLEYPDGRRSLVETLKAPFRGANGAILGMIGICRDITARRLGEQRIEHLSHHDILTDLPNRQLMTSLLEHAIGRAKRDNRRGALLFVDLDRFKTINDSLGHDAGDQVLRAAAMRQRSRLRDIDTLARMGGDEFAVLLEDLPDVEEAAAVAQCLIDELSRPFLLPGGHEAFIGASVGISLFPDDSDLAAGIIQRADSALLQAKEAGRGTYRYYTEALTRAANERLEMEARLRRGLERGEFVLHYQPLVSLADRHIKGVEALVRWRRSGGELVPPGHFIPLAEDTGLIVPLGLWVARAACLQMKAWLDAGMRVETMAVNLSPRQFLDADIADSIGAILADTGLPPQHLELEITETALMEQGADAEAKLRALKALGVRLAIDDFGTGYSSLAYLKRFPIDKLKVDQSFVREIPDDPADTEIVAAVIALAKNLRLEVLAEGIENEAQFEFLRQRGCDSGQGFLFSRPLPADDMKWAGITLH